MDDAPFANTMECDEVPDDVGVMWFLNLEYFRIDASGVRIPRPEATW